MSANADIIPDNLPDHLPEGERMIWQGRPEWKRLALNAYHLRKVALYFAVIVVGQVVVKWADGANFAETAKGVPLTVAMGALACAILAAFAYGSARTTRYTLTNRRILMKVGIALPVFINLPLKQIDGVSFAFTGKGCGTICFKTAGETRLAYLLLWPHARPWFFTKPQPALRDIPDVEAVATRLAFQLGGAMPQMQEQFAVTPGQTLAAE